MSPRPRSRTVPVAVSTDDERDNLVDLLRQIGTADRIYAKLERLNGRDYEYLGTVDPVTPELVDDVKVRFGGGKYRGRVFNDAGYVKGGMLHFVIGGRPKTEDGEDRVSDDRLARIEAKLEKAPAESNGLTMVKEIVAVVTPLMTMLIPLLKPSGNGGSIAETLTLMQTAEEKGERRGLRLGRLENGGGETTMLGVADKYLPPILGMMSKRMEASPTPAPEQSRSTNEPNLEPKTVQVYTPIIPPEYAWLESIRPYYHLLPAQAQHGADPAVVAEFALTQLDDAQLQAVALAVKRADFLETMRTELAPLVARHADWANEFLTHIVEVGTAPFEDEPQEEKQRNGDKQPTGKRSARRT